MLRGLHGNIRGLREMKIEMKGVKKVYPDGTVALRGVDFDVREGEIVGLLGENGAGKTTLMKILSGLLRPTAGEIYVNGERVYFKNPSDALKLGIGMVHQHFSLVPIYNSIENIMLGQEERTGGLASLSLLNLKKAREDFQRLVEETGLKVPLDVPVENLPLGVQQRIEILKLLYRGVNVLILDEPTSFLTPLEVKDLFKILRNLKERGKSIVFITHKLKEAIDVTERVVVLRQGMVTGRIETVKATPEALAKMMVGEEIELKVKKEEINVGKPVLIVKNLKVLDDMGRWAVKGVSFDVKAGEIFGVVGVEGNGQTELLQAITGLRPVESGEIYVNGEKTDKLDPKKLYSQGVSHIPEDRQKYGLILDFTVLENSVLGRQFEPRFIQRMGRLNWSAITEFAKKVIKSFNVVTTSLKIPVRSLSGGNQQRLVVGRELSKNPSLIIAAHPTRGLDVASTLYIRELLLKMREQGKGILLVSADLEEALELSDRIAVMYEGQFLGIGETQSFTIEEIGLMMGGIKPGETKRKEEEKP